MILSMTGFGRGSCAFKNKIINFDVKALNSKQMDLIVKLPPHYRQLEGELRNRVATDAERGKIEVIASVELTGDQPSASFNIPLLKQYKNHLEAIDRVLGIEPPADWHNVLLRLPDVMKTEDNSMSEDETVAFFNAAGDALVSMKTFRIDEGKKLYDFFSEKIDNIRRLLGEVEPLEEVRISKIRSKLYDQLEKLSGVEVDAGRLEQELFFYIEKLDISEEKQRLRAHLDYFAATMGSSDDGDTSPRGKKLGFIAQEMGREINTLGSKSNNAEMQIIVVKMKDELEQIKEQVLNVL